MHVFPRCDILPVNAIYGTQQESGSTPAITIYEHHFKIRLLNITATKYKS